MSQYLKIHPDNPQPRLVEQAVEIIRNDGLIVYPTDSSYALGCHVGDTRGMERMRDHCRWYGSDRTSGALSYVSKQTASSDW